MAAWCTDCGRELNKRKPFGGHMENCPKAAGNRRRADGTSPDLAREPHSARFGTEPTGTVHAGNGDVLRSWTCAVCGKIMTTVNQKGAPRAFHRGQ